MPDEPDYKVYRSRPRLSGKREDDVAEGLQELRDEAPDAPRQPGAKPEYSVHRRRRLPRPRLGGLTRRRVVKWVLSAIAGWLLLSLILFMVSAWIQRKNTSEAARSALTSTGYTLTSANTILVLGSDARQPGTKEAGANVGGPSRADSILLIRAGGGKSAKLSIPRDTVVDIPGHGPDKINAAYAIGGPSLTIQTIENYLGIKINHLVEVNFGNFPEFIDALGGIDVRTNCVHSDINGGKKNGGTTLRLKPGKHHLGGKAALTLARTRKNACHPEENDLDRAKRQQDVLAAIKSRLLSPTTFFRLPWVAWEAPKAVKTDMGGPSLLGLFGAIEIGGNPKPRVLGSLQVGGGVGSTDEERRAAVRKFLRG
jgi:LCP family protein required for cell wall assembly